MRALILAAGEGTRLRPLTDDRPKCMVPFHGRPIIERTIATMRQCGLTDIGVVTGYCADAIPDYGVRKFENARYAETNMVYSLFCAEEFLEGDVVVSYGDIIFSSEVLEPLLASGKPFAVTIDLDWRRLWEARMEDPLKDAETLKLGPAGEILELGRKPKALSEIEGQYMGLFKIAGSAIAEVRKFYHSLDRSLQYEGRPFEKMFMTSFIQLVINGLMPVYSVPVHGGWVEVDCESDVRLPLELISGVQPVEESCRN